MSRATPGNATSDQMRVCDDVTGCLGSFGADVMGMILMSAITILTVIGNSALCWIIYSDVTLRTIPNRFVFSLAMCDLMTAVLNAPFTLIALGYDGWILGHFLCKVNGFLTTFFGVASLVNLAAISVNRCLLIVYQKWYGTFCSAASSDRIIAGGWIFAAACAFPPLVNWSRYTYVPGKAICTILWSTDVAYTLIVLGVGVLLPFLTMLLAYIKIFIKVRESRRKIFSHVTNKNIDVTATLHHVSRDRLNSYLLDDGRPVSGKESSDRSVIRDDPIQDAQSNNDKSYTGSVYTVQCEPRTPIAKYDTFSLNVASRTGSHNTIQYTPLKPDSLLSRRPLKHFNSSTFHRLPSVDSYTSGNLFVVSEMPRLILSQQLKIVKPVTTWQQEVERDEFQIRLPPQRHSLTMPLSSDPSSIPSCTRSASESCISNQKRDRPATWTMDQPSKGRSDVSPVVVNSNLSRGSCRTHEVRLTATLLIVVLVFTISWTPLSVINCMETFSGYVTPRYVDRITIYLVFLQSAIDPLIYGVMNRTFMTGFKKIFCRLCGVSETK